MPQILSNDTQRGKYYVSTKVGQNAFAANQAGVTLSTGLATTYTGLCLSNPASSGVNLVLHKALGSLVVVTTAVSSIHLITGFLAAGITVHTTPLTVFNEKIGTVTTFLGLADSACTLVGTPVWSRPLMVNAGSVGTASFREDVDGGIIIIPGAYVAFGMPIATPIAAGFMGSFTWQEVPA